MDFFNAEILKTTNDILKIKSDEDLCFAMLTDSWISDEGEQTCANIRAVDEKVHFDFICHLGNIIIGNNPKRPSMKIMGDELDMYRSALKSGILFATQGQNDGWRDERYLGQLALGIITDEAWFQATKFIDSYENVSRPSGKPYFYVDIPKNNTRLIFLCAYHAEHDTEIEFFQKYVGFDAQQVKWLKNVALKNCEGKDVLMFSHKIPMSRFETGSDPYIYKGNSTEAVLAIIQGAKKAGANILCHFGGGYGVDENIRVGGINFSVMGNQIAKGRKLGTVEQDLWDAVVVKKKERKIYLFRFGAGEDRVIDF